MLVRRAKTATLIVLVLALAAGAISGVLAWRRAQVDAQAVAQQRGQVRLWATLERLRTDELTHTLQIAVRNDGPLPVQVTRAQLVAPSFADTTPVDVETTIPVGGHRIDIQVPYGVPRCAADTDFADADPIQASTPSQAKLRTITQDGRQREVTLDLPHPNELLDRLLRLECRQQRLAQVGSVRFGTWVRQADGTLRVPLLVERTGSPEPLTVYDVRGSVLYLVMPDPADRPRPLATLPAGQTRMGLPLIVDANRCTGHALGEAKKPFVFPVWLSIDGGENIYTTIPISAQDERELRALSDRRCANG